MDATITITLSALERLVETIVERKLATSLNKAKHTRHYPPRKAISVLLAARITGLSTSTINRLDKYPGNTNYPGRNATVKMLAAWAQLYGTHKRLARKIRAANRPMLGAERW